MQEVLDLFQVDDDQIFVASEPANPTEQLFCTLSVAAVSGNPAPKAMCLLGTIQGLHVKILIDSGSSHCFLSDSVAAQLQGLSMVPSALLVQVANGDKLNKTHTLMTHDNN